MSPLKEGPSWDDFKTVRHDEGEDSMLGNVLVVVFCTLVGGGVLGFLLFWQILNMMQRYDFDQVWSMEYNSVKLLLGACVAIAGLICCLSTIKILARMGRR